MLSAEKSILLSSSRKYAAALALVFLSGAAALAHQVIWVRMMVDVLGAGSGTFARVTGAFFLGLALGAWAASRLQPKRAWRGAAWAEFAVGLFAAGILASMDVLEGMVSHSLLWWLLPFLMILPPAAGMGLVFPWILAEFRDQGEKAVRIYAANTAGAVVGIVVVSAIVLPALGLRGAALAASAGNMVVACGLWLLSGEKNAEVRAPGATPTLPRGLAVAAFLSGFLALGQEVLLQHQFAQVTINSLFSSSVVLGFVLIVLASAALAAPLLVRRFSGDLVAWAALAAAVGCAVQPFLYLWARSGLHSIPYASPPAAYVGEVLFLGLLVVSPALLFSGLIFPALLSAGGGGSKISGKLLAWNGLGGLCGAEVTNFFIAPAFGMWQGMMVCAVGYLALFSARVAHPAGAVAALVVAASFLLGARLPQAGLGRGESLVAIGTGPEGVVGVIKRASDDWRILFNNTYTLGGSKAQYNQERQAHLPILLHGEARSVAMLGVATGSTLAGAALHGTIEKIEAVELSPLTARFARDHFEKFNRHVFGDPRVDIILDDARRVISQSPASFDVVVGDLFLPWKTGEGRLYSQEHFRNVKSSLRSGGLYCQWLPMFQLTKGQFEMILRTFKSVFPEGFLIRGDFYEDQPILGLVGGKDLASLNWEKIGKACGKLAENPEVRDALVRHPEGLALMIVGRPPAVPAGPINTLANAALEWNASRNIIGMHAPWFVGDHLFNYLELADASGLPESFGTFPNVGRALSRNREGLVEKNLPETLRTDLHSDWSQWPSTSKPYSSHPASR